MYIPHISIKDFPQTFINSFRYRDSGFPYSGIYLFSGGQGTGKTLHAVDFILQMKRSFPKVIIVSNVPLNIDGVNPYKGLDDFDSYNNGEDGIIFFLDEIQSMYSSMQSKNVGDSQLYVWAQNRKNRRVIVGTTQRFSRVAKPIREQCKYLIDMRGHFFNIFMLRQYDGYNFDDDGTYCAARPRLQFSVPSFDTYNIYDTRHVVHWDGDNLLNKGDHYDRSRTRSSSR